MSDRPISERLALRLRPPGGRTSCSTPCELCTLEARAVCDELANWLDQRHDGPPGAYPGIPSHLRK